LIRVSKTKLLFWVTGLGDKSGQSIKLSLWSSFVAYSCWIHCRFIRLHCV